MRYSRSGYAGLPLTYTVIQDRQGKKQMPAALIRARGQAALFAGCLLGVFLPFFRIGALTATGYDSAAALSASTKNYGPLLQWTSQHLALAVVFTVLQIIPIAVILAI